MRLQGLLERAEADDNLPSDADEMSDLGDFLLGDQTENGDDIDS